MFHLVGRKYDVDMNVSRAYLYYYMQEVVNGKHGLKRGLKNAQKNKDWKTVKKLQQTIEAYEREMRRLEPYVTKKTKAPSRRGTRQRRGRTPRGR